MSEMKKIMENWRGFKSSNIITEVKEKSFLDKAGDILGKLLIGGVAKTVYDASGLKDKVHKHLEKDAAKIRKHIAKKAIDIQLPIHMRAFAKFLLGSEEVFTENDLSDKEIEALEQAVILLSTKESLPKHSRDAMRAKAFDPRLRLGYRRKISYGHWMMLSRNNDPDGFERYSMRQRKKDQKRNAMNIPQKKSVFSTEVFNSFQRFLGNAMVNVDRSGHVKIVDFYDFNNAKDKENFDELWFDIENVLTPSMLGGDDMYQAIRRMAPYRQAMSGYKGFKVKIEFKLKDSTINSLAAQDDDQKDYKQRTGYEKGGGYSVAL